MAPNGDLPLFGGALSMAAAPHRSIGEVLALLKDEFPDITISKIRFLESQGLLDPERTPSGYRRFYDKDVERLRWILRQQRENFLPLKVIKGRLAEGLDTAEDAPADEPVVIDGPTEPEVPAEPSTRPSRHRASTAPTAPTPGGAPARDTRHPGRRSTGSRCAAARGRDGAAAPRRPRPTAAHAACCPSPRCSHTVRRTNRRGRCSRSSPARPRSA